MGTLEGPVWVRTSIVDQYGTVERCVEPRRVPSCQMDPIWPDGTRRALTDHSMASYGCTTKIGTHTDPRGTLTGPNRTQSDVKM